ncbi:Amidohydrolase family [Nesidiocoris tenuis]|uniref:Amidohydrolase family n=1 Tax=Nesidiocoris tenuis TaxID=355587 RepID=A0ABN7AXU4_9HEMI|nr:Amidohydrolase family [Nesidiocoris tenuis]
MSTAEQPQENSAEAAQNGPSAPAPPAQNGTSEPKPPAPEQVEDVKTTLKTGRQMRQEGQRNLQDSTFSVSEELDRGELKTSVRVRQPPGGVSSGGFW